MNNSENFGSLVFDVGYNYPFSMNPVERLTIGNYSNLSNVGLFFLGNLWIRRILMSTDICEDLNGKYQLGNISVFWGTQQRQRSDFISKVQKLKVTFFYNNNSSRLYSQSANIPFGYIRYHNSSILPFGYIIEQLNHG